MKLQKKDIIKYLKNKYLISIVVFSVWIGFFDKNSLWDRSEVSSRIKQLEKQKEHYETEIEQNKRKIKEIEESPESLEKFAREEYLMKKPNEDLFIIVEEKDE